MISATAGQGSLLWGYEVIIAHALTHTDQNQHFTLIVTTPTHPQLKSWV